MARGAGGSFGRKKIFTPTTAAAAVEAASLSSDSASGIWGLADVQREQSESNWVKIVLAAFTDLFTGGDSAVSIGGTNTWVATSGTWGITGNKAYAVTAASSYPIATVDANTRNAVVKAVSTTASNSGHGVSFWVTDGNNWWGAHTEKTTFTAAPYSCPSGGTVYGSNCTINQPAGGGPYGVTTCPSGGNPFGWGCFNCCWVFAYAASSYTQPAAYNCNSYPGYSLSGSTCYLTYGGTGTAWYKHEIKTVKKTTGSVSVVATTLVADTTTSTDYVAYVQAATNTSSAVITAQMNTGGTVASYTASAGTPARAVRHGMMAGPSTLSPTTSIDSFEYTFN